MDNLFQSLVPLPGLGYCEKNLHSPGSQIFLILQPPWSSGPHRRCASPALRPCSVPGFLPKEFPNRAGSIPSPTFSGETRWASVSEVLFFPLEDFAICHSALRQPEGTQLYLKYTFLFLYKGDAALL